MTEKITISLSKTSILLPGILKKFSRIIFPFSFQVSSPKPSVIGNNLAKLLGSIEDFE
ncbi:MAG: hypothetical protein KKB51_18150 [Candidatus Riflebacteria bacterium]|nr:hypothetical protein [Candidatus Riflebacteria bacterium]